MKKLVLALVALALFTVNAPVQANTETPSSSRWDGWYVGVNGGYASTNNSSTDINYFMNGGTTNHYIEGYTVGLTGGHNWVKDNGLFYGVEADANYMNNRETLTICPSCGSPLALKSKWTGYGTLRGRVGVAFNPALVYLTAGIALADVTDKDIASGTISGQPVTGFSKTGVEVGWTAGAGTEFALADHLSMSAQYLYLSMAGRDTILNCPGCSFPGEQNFRLNDSANIIRFGLNYTFN